MVKATMRSVMQAVEFDAKIKNGKIEIPPNYQNKLGENVKVILLAEEKEDSIDMIDYLTKHPINVNNFKPLSRDEIYDRG